MKPRGIGAILSHGLSVKHMRQGIKGKKRRYCPQWWPGAEKGKKQDKKK